MKQILVILFLLVSYMNYGQNIFIVTAENGLFLRSKPDLNADIIGKLPFGTELEIIEKTDFRFSLSDNKKEIEGIWVKVEIKNFPSRISNAKSGFVFSGYLEEKTKLTENLKQKMAEFSEFDNYIINQHTQPFYLNGDFFGDGITDIVILIKDKSDNFTKIGFINYGLKNEVLILGNGNDNLDINDYAWVGIFEKVNKGEILRSNYKDDRIDYKDLTENAKNRLNYDALYLHALESCGGGIIYWKNGKFNWLQQ